MQSNFTAALARLRAHRLELAQEFEISLAEVLKSEGGYVNDPRDPGGATDHGVTQREYDHFRAEHFMPAQDVRLIGQSEIEAIYRGDYWAPIHGDDLPAGVDYCVFDFAVNSGPARAVRFMQIAAGVAGDGIIGPATLGAIRNANPIDLISRICSDRLSYLKSLPTWWHFRNGWESRVDSVRAKAEAMAA